MPTHKKNLYELTEYPAILKKRGKPVLAASVAGVALISRRRSTYGNQELGESADRAGGERQIREVECRPESQANTVADCASQRAFHGIAERAAQEQTCEHARRGSPGADDRQCSGGRNPEAPHDGS